MTSSLGRGAAWGLLTVGIERGLSFLTLLVVARVLEPDRFGLYAYLIAGVMPIQVMADQGIEVAAVGRMARRQRGQGETLVAVLVLRLALWALIGLPVGLGGLAPLADCSPTTAAVATLGILLGPSMPYRSLERARGAMAGMWRIAVADAGVMLAGTAIVLAAGGGVVHVLGVRAATGLLVTTGAWYATGMPLRLGRALRRSLRPLLVAAWPLALNAALLTLMVRAGMLVAMTLVGARAVGELGAAARVAEVLSLVPEGVMLAAFPSMAARPANARGVADQVARNLGLLVSWMVAGCVAGAAPIVWLLFGADYGGAAPLLAILAWGALVSATGSVMHYRLVVEERQWLLLRVNLIAALVGVALQVPLVWGFGSVGAALATVATLTCGQLVLALDAQARPIVLGAWARVLPTAIVAVGAVAAGRAVGSGTLALLVTLLAYPAGVALAGLAGRAEVQAVRHLLADLGARFANGGRHGRQE